MRKKKPSKVHYGKPITACGRRATKLVTAHREEQVTCGTCLYARFYQAA